VCEILRGQLKAPANVASAIRDYICDVSDFQRTDFFTTGPFSVARVLSALMSHPTLAVAAVRSGRIRRANDSWHELFGTEHDPVIEPLVTSIFAGARSAERFERVRQNAFDKGVARVEHLLMRADGSAFMAEMVVHMLAGDNSFGADAVWQVRDITAERELRRELREMEEYYRSLSTHQWDLTFVLDQNLSVCFASPSVEAVLGYRSSELIGERFEAFVKLDELGPVHDVLERVRARDPAAESASMAVQLRHRDGSYRTLSCRPKNCLDIARISGIVVNARDISDEVSQSLARENFLRRSAELREALFALATQPSTDFRSSLERITSTAFSRLAIQSASYWRFDPAQRHFRCEHTTCDTEQLSDPMRETIHEDHFPLYTRELHSHRPIVVNDVREHAAVSAAHLERLVRANVGAMLDFPVGRNGVTVGVLSLEAAGGPRNWDSEEISFAAGLSLLVALAIESDERAAAAARTEFMALHDALTGLANRNRAEEALRDAISLGEKSRAPVALLLIDLDEFKEINDTFGHGRGDALLSRVARVLSECAGPDSLVARMGGDEFLIILKDEAVASAESLAQSIIDRLSTEHLLIGVDQHVGASIGIAEFPKDASDAEALLANADIAMYQAKAGGRNQAFAFDARLAQRLRLQRELDLEIRDALRAGQFSLFYQPQIDLESNAVIGLEALLRWEHPKRGLLLPSTFMAAAEHNGLIDVITKWALTEACEQNVAWQRAGLGTVPISVNVTGRQFHDRHLPAIIAGALMRTGLSAHNLILEVTEESLIVNSKTTERVLAELRRLGVRIAIDDFGVGYSSLSYLRRLVVNQIKLDKAFIEGLPADTESSAVIGAVISIARRLKYQVIAEGIETRAQLDHLRALGCEAGQGFFFGAPLSATEIVEYISEQPRRRVV
jgi:diguanylate cyclase (GGDEF)-like protein/PAS domain S-box-containing protein